MKVYLDHNATTPPHPDVLDQVPVWLSAWGNPSSVHEAGRDPKRILRESREAIAQFFNVDPFEIIFTSGGSESISLALKGAFEAVRAQNPERRKVVISSVEHPAVRETAMQLAEDGAEVVEIPVARSGALDLEFARTAIDAATAIVSVMIANNETGTIFPVKEIAGMAHEHGAIMHSDGVQAMGKIPLNLKSSGVDLASFSAHKFYALRGCGVLFHRKGVPLQAQIRGGGHERRRRAGTENTLAIAALAHMCRMPASKLEEDQMRMRKLRDEFEDLVRQELPGSTFTGDGTERLPNTSNVVVPGADGETLLMGLDLKGFAVSSGSACSSGSSEPSRILMNMGLSRSEADRSLRVSLGTSTTGEDLEAFVKTLKSIVQRVDAVHRGEAVGVNFGT